MNQNFDRGGHRGYGGQGQRNNRGRGQNKQRGEYYGKSCKQTDGQERYRDDRRMPYQATPLQAAGLPQQIDTPGYWNQNRQGSSLQEQRETATEPDPSQGHYLEQKSGDRSRSHSRDSNKKRSHSRSSSGSGSHSQERRLNPQQTSRGMGPPQLQGSSQQYAGSHYNQQQYYGQGQDYNNFDSHQYRPPRWEQDDLVFLSRTLSSVLRHNAAKFKLKLMKGGFIYVDDILRNVQKLWGFDLESIKYVVDNNDKKRFTLEMEPNGRWKIRANQGHTMEVEELDLKPITSADDFPRVIHGTYYQSWEAIKRTGLCRMNRNHIHFAAGEPGHDGVISGMRSSCEVMISIDLEKALKDGIKFFLSSNNVILCPGNDDGYLFPCYFQGAMDRRKRFRLDFDDKISFLKSPGNTEAGTSQESKKQRKKNKKKNKEQRDVHETEQGNPEGKEMEAFTEPEVVKSPAKEKTVSDELAAAENKKVKRDNSGEREKTLPRGRTDDPVPEWIETPTFLTDTETSASAVDHIVSRPSPVSVIVCCCGKDLGQETSDIALMVVMARPEIYIYHFKDGQKNLVADGRLKDLLMSKDISKVFHNIGSVSPSLIQEFDIVMNGVPIWDIALMWEKCTPSNIEKEALKENFGIKVQELAKTMKAWEIENVELAEKLEHSEQDVVDKLIQRGKLMAELYRICRSRVSEDLVKTLKKEIFPLAIPSKDHFLVEKIKALKLKEKKDKKETNQGQEQATPKPEQKSNKHQQSPKKGKGKKK